MVLFLAKISKRSNGNIPEDLFEKNTYFHWNYSLWLCCKVKIFMHLSLKISFLIHSCFCWVLNFLLTRSLYIPSVIGTLSAFLLFNSGCWRPLNMINYPGCDFLNNTFFLWQLSTPFNATKDKKKKSLEKSITQRQLHHTSDRLQRNYLIW